MREKERVSVIMPWYNDGDYIEQAIASLAVQTYPNIELILIDDGSDDAKTLHAIDRVTFIKIEKLHTIRFEADREGVIACYDRIYQNHRELYLRHLDDYLAHMRKRYLEHSQSFFHYQKLLLESNRRFASPKKFVRWILQKNAS